MDEGDSKNNQQAEKQGKQNNVIQRYGINVELLRFRFDHLKANKNISCCLKNLLNVNRCDIFSELVKFVTKPSV